jgi:N-acetylneuraminic acid mutarotase
LNLDGAKTLSTLHEFDFSDNSWRTVSYNSTPPPHRYRHTAAVNKNCMFIFGGVDQTHIRFNDVRKYDFETKLWSQLSFNEDIPTRSFHGSVVVDEEMFIFGGYDGTSRLNQVHKCAVRVDVQEPEAESGEKDSTMMTSLL